jgi:hypothetical protein
MEINVQPNRQLTMSPFPYKVRPYTEVVTYQQDVTIPAGVRLPQLIHRLYGVTSVTPFTTRLSFLSRDDKERKYKPAVEDPFVMKDISSINDFKSQVLLVIERLTAAWVKLGLPTKYDEDRQITAPDTAIATDALQTTHPLHSTVMRHYSDVCFIVANYDIASRASLVRNVSAGWWCSSYAAKKTPDPSHFADALEVLARATEHIMTTSRFKNALKETQDSMGSTLFSNVGYPLYSAEVSADNQPVAKQKVVDLYKNLMTPFPNTWDELKTRVDDLAPYPWLKGFPFATACVRREQPGYKWMHVFSQTGTGLATSHDVRGFNTVRMAFACPYILNLIFAPLQAVTKSLRKVMPGLMFTGELYQTRLKSLQKSGAYVMESDYSNYDRFMPYGLFIQYMRSVVKGLPHSDFWISALTALHEDVPLIWPDYVPGASHRGWIFKPGPLGLLSGLLITSDEGTIVNNIVTVASLLDAKVFTKESMYAYLVSYVDTGNMPADEKYFIQSDDLAFMSKDPDELYAINQAFKTACAAAGLKASSSVADRFLMKQIFLGRYTPVLMRVFQNTVSPERGVTDPLKFMVGLMQRTDGLCGYREVDPWGLGHDVKLSALEAEFAEMVLEMIRHRLVTSAHPLRPAVQYMDALIDLLRAVKKDAPQHVIAELRQLIVSMRRQATMALVDRELSLNAHGSSKDRILSYIQELLASSNSPSSMALLEQLEELFPELTSVVEMTASQEHQFFTYAMKMIGLPVDIYKV